MLRALLLCLLALLLTGPAVAQPADRLAHPQQAERSRTYDVLHYRIALRLDEATQSFEGTTTITLSPLQDGFTKAVFDAETFEVTGATNEAGAALDFEQANGQLTVRLPRAYAYGDTLDLTVAYEAHGVDVDPTAYGMSAGYDLGLGFKAATDDNPQLAGTLSFPTGARHWFPSYDHPNDRATQETLVTVRDDWRVLSNGRLVSVKENGDGTHTVHWSQEQSHPTYLFVLAAGPYVVLDDAYGDLPLHYWVYEKDVPDAMRSFEKTAAIIGFFEEVYGVAFPWVKYDQVTIPGIGGGAESTTATVLGQSTIHDERADQDFPSHWLIAHEAAHQWWGNLVSYRDWTHTWVSESFATFSEYWWACHDLGMDECALNLDAKKNAYIREARDRYRRPIVFDRWTYPNDNFDRHTYEKGAVVLHMLREILGEKPFHRTLQHFLTKHAYQPVDTHDFMIAVKEATGQNLDWFFEQWLLHPGHPAFEVTSTWDDAAKEVRLTIRQVQDTTTGTPIYRLPVDIGLTTSSGTRTERVWLSNAAHTFTFPRSEKPLLVRFDAGNDLLKEWTFEKGTEDLLYQLAHDDAMGRIWAAGQLAAFLHEPGVRPALQDAARTADFWAVRRAAVEALAAAPQPDDLVFFKTQATDDAHSRVRAAVLVALGNTKDPALAAFFRERFANDDSYVAQAEALRALGKTGDASDVPFLEAAASMHSPRNLIHNAATWAMERIGEKY